MAQKSDSLLHNEKEVIKQETNNDANTQVRIGTMFENMIDSKINNDKIVDEDDMISDSDTKIPTQQSVKAYVDANLPENAGGTVISGNYDFSTITTAGDPGTGVLRFNSPLLAGVSAIYVAALDKDGDDPSAVFASLATGDRLRVQLASDPNTFLFVRLTALPINNTTWWNMPIAFLQSGGALPANGVEVILTVIFSAVVFANETLAGIVEEATDAEVLAGTGTGGSGARLFINPAKMAALRSLFVTEHFSGNGSTTVFTIPATGAIQILAVFVGGQRLRDGTHYIKNEAAKTVTISPAVITGVGIEVEYLTGIAAAMLNPNWNETTWGLARIATFAEVMAGVDDTKGVTPLKMKLLGDYTETPVTPSGGVMALNCNNQQQIRFLSSIPIITHHTITKSNTTNIQNITLVIPITGASIQLTWPSDTRMARYNESGTVWNQSTKVLIVSSIGTGDLHEFNLMKTGSVFILRYDGPVRA